jgi:hypothetical protein
MLGVLTSNLSILMLSTWGCFVVYLSWYVGKVKWCYPITSAEARQLWIIHKRDTHCKGRRWRQLKKGKQTVGFQCDCGYRHTQKRPVLAHAPTAIGVSQASAFDRLHASHNSA